MTMNHIDTCEMQHSSDPCAAYEEGQAYDFQYNAEHAVGIDEARRHAFEEGYAFAHSETQGDDPWNLGPIERRLHPGTEGQHSPHPCAAFLNGRDYAIFIRGMNGDEIEFAFAYYAALGRSIRRFVADQNGAKRSRSDALSTG